MGTRTLKTLKESSETNLMNTFYLTQYIQNIIILVGNEVFLFFFIY